MKVSNFTIKVSKRPVRGSYTALVDPDRGDLGPVGEDNVIDYTAWFQNPEGESNRTDPITVPFNESVTAQGVPADITAVKVYWRRNGGPTRFLVDLTDVGAGNWAYVGYDGIPLNNPPHIGPPWEDIEFTAKYISPDGAVWQDWVYANVSHVAPPPTWDLPPIDGGGGWDGPSGGTIGDCLTAWAGGTVMGVFVDDLAIENPTKIRFACDVLPPDGVKWKDLDSPNLTTNLMGLAGLQATDLVAAEWWDPPPDDTWYFDWIGVDITHFEAFWGAGTFNDQLQLWWDSNKYYVDSEWDTADPADLLTYNNSAILGSEEFDWDIGSPSWDHSKRTQFFVEIDEDQITFMYRFPDDDPSYFLPLSDWSTYEDRTIFTFDDAYAFTLNAMGFDIGRMAVGGNWYYPFSTGVEDADLVGEEAGYGVLQEGPFWKGSIMGYYLECDDVPLAGINDWANVSVGTPVPYGDEAWRYTPYSGPGMAYSFTDELGAASRVLIATATSETVCFRITY